MSIKILSLTSVNRIAAGEVIERPLSVVKELVENSLDAGATKINILISRGGRNFISVSDNGSGIPGNELALALERHATSKLDEENLDNITYLGFRGEALPSIAAVSRLKILSAYMNESWEIESEGGHSRNIRPSSLQNGTCVEIRDLFFTAPTRLKFLKSEALESRSCVELINRLALSRCDVAFELVIDERRIINYSAHVDSKSRIAAVLGTSFIKNAVKVSVNHKNIEITGFSCIPAYTSPTSTQQHFFINNRVIKDKIFSASIKTAYNNLIPYNRAARIVLFMRIDNNLVDVNVHPTKAEVRFVNKRKIKELIIDGVQDALNSKTAIRLSPLADKMKTLPSDKKERNSSAMLREKVKTSKERNDCQRQIVSSSWQNKNRLLLLKYSTEFTKPSLFSVSEKLPLGFAKCHINNTYIIAEKDGNLILVDQYAAYKQIILGKIIKEISNGAVLGQMLPVPEIVELGASLTNKLIAKCAQLQQLSIIIERNGITQILVRQVPFALQNIDVCGFIQGIAENINILNVNECPKDVFFKIWEQISHHLGMPTKNEMSTEEMNSFLRLIEEDLHARKSNNENPVFIKLDWKNIQEIFKKA